MSDPDPQPGLAGRPVLALLLIAAGIVLLFPGLCSLAAIVVLGGIDPNGVFDPRLILLWAACFAASAGGIMIIRHAWTRSRSRG